MKVAVVGGGVAGLAAAYALAGRCDVELFEADVEVGGHVRTVAVPGGAGAAVDLGFIVYEESAYPHLTRLFAELGVATRPTDMSFSVSAPDGLEYASADVGALFADRRTLVSPRHWRLIVGLLRFLRQGRADAEAGLPDDLTLGELLRRRRVGDDVVARFVVPLAAAIWSAAPRDVLALPAATTLRFLARHGMLHPFRKPTWRTIVGGSRRYVEALLARLPVRVHAGVPVVAVRRRDHGAADGARVELELADGRTHACDRVVLAVHSDQALAMLAPAGDDERALLGAIRYTRNQVWLHGDESFLPRRPAARAAWNYHLEGEGGGRVMVTYWMNRLQGLAGPRQYLVTLNPVRPPDPATVLERVDMAHPLHDVPALRAQHRIGAVQGRRGTYFCGAWLGHGFHEDGWRSGLVAAARLLADGASP